MAKVLEVNDLRVYFHTPSGPVKAVDGINFSLEPGERFGLVGESGCGKSLTMKSIFGMIDFEPGIVSGKINFFDNDKNKTIQILDTNKRTIIKNPLVQSYFMFDHLKVKDNTIVIPEKFKIDY